jgi:hypothetical protein
MECVAHRRDQMLADEEVKVVAVPIRKTFQNGNRQMLP